MKDYLLCYDIAVDTDLLAPFMKEQNKAINKHIVEMKKMFETNTTLS